MGAEGRLLLLALLHVGSRGASENLPEIKGQFPGIRLKN
jgi:hypothetical protein